MNSNPNDGTAGSCRLHRFEKNRYFHGKLMTARDMEAEQQYNVGRQRTLTRHVAGEGLLCGLDVTVTEDDDTLTIRVGTGLAVDCCGNPIVVASPHTEELTPPAGDNIYVLLEFVECSKESVPIPGSENACEQECAYNRILESFEVSFEEGRPDPSAFKTVAETVEYPDSDDFPDEDEGDEQADDDPLGMMARTYYEGTRSECETCDDPSVFVGAFRRSEEDGWVEDVPDKRPFVYTNDMLYAALAGHVADFNNPHEVSAAQAGALVSVAGVANPGGNVALDSSGGVLVDPDDENNEIGLDATAESVGALASIGGVENPGGDVALESSDDSIDIDADDAANEVDFQLSDSIRGRFEEFEDQLTELRSEFDDEIEQLRDRLNPLERYVMDKTLKYKQDAFTDVRDRFRTETVDRLLALTEDAIDSEVFRDREAYFEFLTDALGLERAIAEEVEGQATPETLERYVNALDHLEEALAGERRVVEAAVEQDFVCETAERLELPPLTEIDGIGTGRRDVLRDANITNLRELIESDPETITRLPFADDRVDENMVREWIAEAREILGE